MQISNIKSQNNKLKLKIFKNLSFLIVVFIFSLFIFDLKEASAAFKINRPPALNSGLVGHWTFDGKNVVNGVALDSTANANNGNLINIATSTFYAAGKIGQGFNFDGTDDYVKYTTDLGVTGEITVSAWVNPAQPPGGTGRLIASTYDWDADPSLARGWFLGVDSGSSDVIRFRIYDSSGNNSLASLNNFFANNLNKWTQVVGVYKPSTYLKLFVNGALAAQDTSSVPSAIANKAGTNFRIGARADVASQGLWNGLIDEVRVYNRALSVSEVKSLYNQGASKLNKTPTNILTNGLVGHWTFDGKNVVNGVALDSTANANNGNLINIATSTFYAAGKIGQGFNFDGTNDYIDVGNKDIIDGGKAASVCFWMKYNPFSVIGDGAIAAKWNSGGGWAIWVDDTDILGSGKIDTISFAVNVGVGANGGRVVGSTGLVTSGAWDYYCGTFQGGSFIRFYKNGILDNQNTTNIVETVVSTAQPIYFANSADASLIKYLDANLDDVRIYNRALSAGEIKMLYNMGR